MRPHLGRVSLVVLVFLASRCTFPDVSMVASSGASGESGDDLSAEGGDPTKDAFPLADGGLREDDGESEAGGDAGGSRLDLDATEAADGDASMFAEAGARPADGASPVDAVAPRIDASALLDADALSHDAAAPVRDAGHDAGQKKQYPAGIDCSSVDLADCNSTIGFSDDPDCGDTGTLVQCGTSTSRSDNGNGNSDGNDEASRDKGSCVILLQVTAVQTCL